VGSNPTASAVAPRKTAPDQVRRSGAVAVRPACQRSVVPAVPRQGGRGWGTDTFRSSVALAGRGMGGHTGHDGCTEERCRGVGIGGVAVLRRCTARRPSHR
jgi:hypothetical protein